MTLDFDVCYAKYSANTTDGEALRARWGWHGPLVGIAYDPLTQISREGCLAVCGTGTATNPWVQVSSTITTWILPVIGTLLQAPFESNATGRTFLAITRWIGSPIASLSYVLWNIKVSAKAALMVDMAVKYDETPHRKTDFGSMRDSMYLLLVMNQYTLKPTAALQEKEAEGLLRIVLFSKDLKLTDTDKTLRHMRRILAREVREMRRRGVVPVFISTMWFLFAFALSIQAAFGNLGQGTADDLALGCLLAWFPVLILGSIVDRNPIATEAIRIKLNALVDHVRHALRDEHHRKEFVDTFQDQGNFVQLKTWVEDVSQKGEHMNDFFVNFAGQARIRWHYGAAHPILCDIENCYIAEKGRNWLANEQEARANLVLGPVNAEGLVWFDIREFWQVASAIIIVGGSCGGAFILIYFTPTVGLGCRSGGYTIFFCIALGLLVVEMTVWLVLSPYQVDAPLVTRTANRLRTTVHQWEHEPQDPWRYLKRRASSFLMATEGFLVSCIVAVALLIPWRDKVAVKKKIKKAVEEMMRRLRDMSAQRKWEVFFFRPVETFNLIWLMYIVLGQTLGWFTTCDCMTSNWAGGGGYLDFTRQDRFNSTWIIYFWTAGTALTALVMGLSMFYMTVEWCQQSFLSTEDYKDAMEGLRKTRTYRHWTFFFRLICRGILRWTLDPMEKFAVHVGLTKKTQKTMLWTRGHTWNPTIRPSTPLLSATRDLASRSIALTDYPTAPRVELHLHNTPALAHSLFPPAISTRHTRHESDSSSHAPALRASEDSWAPFLPRPSGTYQRAELQVRTSSEEGVSFDEHYSPSSLPDGCERLSIDAMVHSRQGYQRASSDPGSPPVDVVGASRGSLSIRLDQDRDLERGESTA